MKKTKTTPAVTQACREIRDLLHEIEQWLAAQKLLLTKIEKTPVASDEEETIVLGAARLWLERLQKRMEPLP